jgi:nitrate/nitrite transport system permease protein
LHIRFPAGARHPVVRGLSSQQAFAMKFFQSLKLEIVLLPLVGILLCLGGWAIIAGKATTTTLVDDWGDTVTKTERHGISKNLPSPTETWTASKPYIVEPVAKRGELDQGMLRFAWLSLKLVAQGYFIALLVGTPIGFFLGLSKNFTKAFDPIIQILRPVSPLAWLPLGMVLFSGLSVMDENGRVTFGTSDAAALFTIAICAMWPTVLNTAVGVRAVPQDYLNVAKVLKLSKMKTLFKVLIPSALPYMFTGFRLSLGIAWLVIVAVEMLIGKPGVGGFLWQQYNANSYAHIILSILTIGVIGFVLDRLMSLVEGRFRTA